MVDKVLLYECVASCIGIHVQQIKRHVANPSQPSADAIKKIAKCCVVATDWLLFEDAHSVIDDVLKRLPVQPSPVQLFAAPSCTRSYGRQAESCNGTLCISAVREAWPADRRRAY